MGKNDNYDSGFKHTLFAPLDPNVNKYYSWSGHTLATPYEYTGWQRETLTWKQNCYIHTFLSDLCAAVTTKGPDAEKLLSYMCVNNFSIEKFPIGRAKHIIACTPSGSIASHGMCLRIAKDEFVTYFMEPNVSAHSYSGKFNVHPPNSDEEADFIFQLAGPKSLEVVENAVKQDIHDLEFMEFMSAQILGYDVRILRMGMGGTLSYEIHGSIDHIYEIYNEIMRVGEPFGITKMGVLAYMCNHTENGFPQSYEHFLADYYSDPELMAFFSQTPSESSEEGSETDYSNIMPVLYGSLADMGIEAYYLNPIEADWQKMIHWDHDFVGKDALKKIVSDPSTKKVVTLEWHHEDVLKVFASFFDDEPGVSTQMRIPQDYEEGGLGTLADKVVDDDGNFIGKSSGRIYTLYYKKMISMAFIDPEFSELGNEVTVIWGNPGTRQIPIRAKIVRYPYLDLPQNRDFDVNAIPRYKG